MSIDKEKKIEIIKKYAITKNDTGSSEVQVSVLTERIVNLSNHMKIHKNDFHSKRGLLKAVGKRRRLLNYLKMNKYNSYLKLIKSLGLRH